jgi:iron complex outermembrane receptor protein
VNFSSQVGINTVADKVDKSNADSLCLCKRNRSDAQKGLLGTANTNWQDEIFKRF